MEEKQTGKKLFKPGKSGNPAGRPKGKKNATTLFREVIREGFEKQLQRDFNAVLKVVIQRAKDGDMVAAKMLFDRAVPVTKAVELDRGNGMGAVNIIIGSLEDVKQITIDDAEFEEIENE
jgi:hypothetical protein